MTFWKIAFSFRGSINRQTFWLSYIIIFIGIAFAGALLESGDEGIEGMGAILICTLCWPMLAVAAKRWHDRGKSGWWTLIILVPFIGFFWALIELGFLAGVFEANYQIRENVQYMFGDLIAMLAKLAKSDGNISSNEINVADGFFQQILSEPEQRAYAIQIFREAKTSLSSFEQHARRFNTIHQGNNDMLLSALTVLFYVSVADGNMCSEEEILLNHAISIFGVRSSEYDAYKNQESERQQSETKDAKYYASVLGLKGKVTKDEIRSQYRQLVTQYHPDKVAHLGEKLITVAEEEIKKINEAYDYLKKAYHF